MFRTAQLVLRETNKVLGATASPRFVSGFSTASNGSRRLAGKVAVITGAASGIGKATAEEFIRNGAKVIIADVQDELGHAVAAELGPDASYTRCDVADEAQVAAAVDLAVERHGHLDILFSNAGIEGAEPQDDMVSLDLGNFDRLMAVNARAALAGIKHAARVMAPRRRGSIICTSSAAGILPLPAFAMYSISKATSIAIVRATAEPLARDGLRVNAISPGSIRTPMLVRYLGLLSETSPGLSEEIKQTAMEPSDAGPTMEPVEIARAALFLASDEAMYVTGHNLVVDGGYSVHKGADALARTSSDLNEWIRRETNRVLGATTSPRFVSGFSTASNGSRRLAGKVAVITGTASGIGKATAEEFIRNGVKVIIADVQDELGHAVAVELGSDASYTRCDVADEAQVAAAVNLAVERHGHLDILFSNAGIAGAEPQDDMVSLDLGNFDCLMAVNARAALAGIKHAARVMAPRRRGSIICTSSAAGVLYLPAFAMYSHLQGHLHRHRARDGGAAGARWPVGERHLAGDIMTPMLLRYLGLSPRRPPA
ncbi:hypothetical protein ABZP36_002062 [Zizania latifolia]